MADTQDTENDNIEDRLPASTDDNSSQEDNQSNDSSGKNEKDILDPTGSGDKMDKSPSEHIQDAKDKANTTRNVIKNVGDAIRLIANIPFVGPIIIVAIVIIIILVGIYGFFSTIPGLMIGNLKEIAQGGIDLVQSWFTTTADAYVNDDDVIELANYLEEMEYDLIGYGFIVPSSSTDLAYPTVEELEDMGYVYGEVKINGDSEEKGKNRYYKTDEDGNKSIYEGLYYNSDSLLINNETAEVVESQSDKSGLLRSTEDLNTNGDGIIIGKGNADVKLLRTYLLSDYRIYAIRNNNETLTNKIYAWIKSYFGGYDSAWSKGLLKFYYAEDGKAISEWSQDILASMTGNAIDIGDSIKISGTNLTIKNGYFNDSITFNIDGWADRYGMSLEFLLSLHLATGAPDLVYAMLQSFDTEVQVYLNDSGKAEVQAGYVDLLNSSKDMSDIIVWSDVESALSNTGHNISKLFANTTSLLSGLTGLSINNKVAEDLLRELGLTSPSTCTGTTLDYVVIQQTEMNPASTAGTLEQYGITEDIDPEVYAYESDLSKLTSVSGEENLNTSISVKFIDNDNDGYNYNKLINDGYTYFGDSDYEGANDWISFSDIKALGYDISTVYTAPIETTELGNEYEWEYELDHVENKNGTETEFYNVTLKEDNDNNSADKTVYTTDAWGNINNIYKIKKVKQTKTWTGSIENEEGEIESVNYEWVTFKYLIYAVYMEGYNKFDDEFYVGALVYEYIARGKSASELISSGIDETGSTLCSDNQNASKCCDECKRYVKAVMNAIADVTDRDYESYTPYIARVLGSWFRDTYFVIPNEEVVYLGGTVYKDTEGNQYNIYNVEDASAYNKSVTSDRLDIAIQDYIEEASRNDVEMDMISNAYGTEGSYVTVDEEYLADTGEYWTSYEMKDSGEYQLYYLKPNGTISDITMEDFLSDPKTVLEKTDYAGNISNIPNSYINSESENEEDENETEEDEEIKTISSIAIENAKEKAEADGFAFVKKAKTMSSANLEPDASIGDTVWSAYEFGTNGSTGWIKIERTDDANDYVDKVYNIIERGTGIVNTDYGGFYYNMTSTNTVTQNEDAQRSETNPTVKWLFKYRKYYLYDGTTETAERIAEDKEAVTMAVANFLDKNVAKSSVDANAVAKLLGEYGRSALRQTYAKIKLTDGMFYVGIDTLTEDGRDLAEQWLEWQLDMYYSGVINGYYNKNGKYIVYDGPLLDDINWDEYGLTGRGNGDPRDPDLIGTVSITKSSLDAFSILENTKTLAAEYAYRDFKELIVELDYFDKEDLSDKIDSVFTWVIPELDPIGWPTRKWDKQDINYGILIESASTYDYLEEINYDPTLLDSSGEEDEEEDNTEEEENLAETNTNDSNSANTASIAENKIFYIGDSWIERLENYGDAASPSSYFDGVTSTNARDHDSSISIPSDASCIVVAFGLNDTDAASQTQTFINELVSNNPSLPVYVLRTPHVGSGYTSGTTNANTMNSNIDNYNSEMKSYCEGKSYVYYIDPTSNIVEDNGNGYLKDEYKDGEYHLNSEGNKQWYKDIISIITSDSSITTAVKFDGYEGGELVASPVTGKVIEYGTHERTNIYTGDTEEVGYITIQAMDSGKWFTEDNVSNNSGDTDDVSNADIAEGLNLFYDEYEDVCAGYTITIDGFNVDLNIQDESENNGSYEQNEVMALYNSGEQRKREDNEEKKDNAPFFVCVDGDDVVGSLPDTYESAKYDENDKAGYYIKEGKYIGSTYTDDDVTNNITEDVENGSVINIVYKTKTDEEGNEVETSEVDHYEYYDGPANYIRMMVKTTDFSVIDNVEDFFDIPDPEDETTTVGNAELSDLELLFFTIGEGGPWKEYSDIAGSYYKTRTDNPNALTFVANKKNGDTLEVGIIQWTTSVSAELNNVTEFCKAAYEYNSTVFSALSAYSGLSNVEYSSNSSYWTSLAKDMLAIWNSNPNELMNFEISYAKEGYYDPIIRDYPWLAERPSIVQGMVMSIYVYNGSDPGMHLSESMTDEEIIDTCQPYLDAGRSWQSGLAKDYLAGNISAAQLEEFVYYGTIDGVAGTSKY